ncbi:Coiled-coil domain-containing protein [Entamoeba marina]
MAERKATNKYIPPDFDPAIHKSVNDYHKIHPLRNRARKINQGILIIRIELPFGIWCDRCHSLHGKGTRFNAEKKSVGMYYSTKIFELSFKCKDCVNKIVLRTDPENTRYIVVSGGKKQFEKEQEVIQLVDVDDPIQRLEKDQEQKMILINIKKQQHIPFGGVDIGVPIIDIDK